ncbi:glutathione S-transferase [Salinarimonas soli]|uniref:Glutathione S-transferase n=1 Tax=Salinarimonas soli TaxID=1638099 RepID=A0A5B2V8M9_9HYPH|nr:glutathione S-transferase [Salinarimonas soli]KAA2234925.1 glutathione S-transferase [Salinarimonas soli]
MASDTLNIEDAVNEACPWSGKPVAADALTLYRDHVVGFCNPGCRDKFAAAVAHFDRAIEDAEAAADVPLIARGLD